MISAICDCPNLWWVANRDRCGVWVVLVSYVYRAGRRRTSGGGGKALVVDPAGNESGRVCAVSGVSGRE